MYAFLSSGLGLPLGGSAKLTGSPVGTTVVLTVSKPSSLGLPSGIIAPAFGSTKIVIDPKTNTLTATSSATGSGPATLSIRIANANTTSLSGTDLSAHLSLTQTVLTAGVTLSGPMTQSAGRPTLALHGTTAAAVVLRTGAVTLGRDAAITVSTAGGIQVAGTAVIGAGVAVSAVAVAGTVTSATSWTLAATPPAAATAWTPFTGITVTPKFTGTISDVSGAITFDLKSAVATTWAPAGTKQAVTMVEFADIKAPNGGGGVSPGDGWVALTGPLSIPAGAAGTLTAAGSIVIDTVTGHGALSGTQSGRLVLAATPAVALSGLKLAGALTARALGTTGTVTGTGSVGAAGAAPSTATVSVTTGGVVVVDFNADLSPFGLAAPGHFGEVLWAAAPVPAYLVASSGATIALGVGFSSSTGTPAKPHSHTPDTHTHLTANDTANDTATATAHHINTADDTARKRQPLHDLDRCRTIPEFHWHAPSLGHPDRVPPPARH